MTCIDVYPLITTRKLGEVRDFYRIRFGLTVVFEASWVVMLGLPGQFDRLQTRWRAALAG